MDKSKESTFENEIEGVSLVWNPMPNKILIGKKVAIPQAIHYQLLAPTSMIAHKYASCPDCFGVLNSYCEIIDNYEEDDCFDNEEAEEQNNFEETQLVPEETSNQSKNIEQDEKLERELNEDIANCEREENITIEIESKEIESNEKNEESFKEEDISIGVKCCFCKCTFSCEASELLNSNNFTYEKPGQREGRILIFAIDLTLNESELSSVIESVSETISNLEGDARVGLVVFSQFVFVHEFSDDIENVMCFSALKRMTPPAVAHVLGLGGETQKLFSRFLVRVGERRKQLIERVQGLKKNNKEPVKEERRATGQALAISLTLLHLSPRSGRVVLLVGGPCNFGLGKAASHSSFGSEFYRWLNSLERGIVDAFFFTTQESHLEDMNSLLGEGLLALHEEFNSNVFKDTFREAYDNENSLKLGHSATLEVKVSSNILINGLLANAKPLPIHETSYASLGISEHCIGYGKTNKWNIGSIDSHKTVTLVYELEKDIIEDENYYIQFELTYINDKNILTYKVTTIKRSMSDNLEVIGNGFDSESAATLLLKMALYEKKPREFFDETLCRWASFFATFPAESQLLKLPGKMPSLLQYIYFMRRNGLFSVPLLSPDERFYRRYLFLRESSLNVVLMIQPALLEYSFESIVGVPRKLSAKTMRKDVILFLDSFFTLVVWRGAHIQEWIDDKLHEKADNCHLLDLIEAPMRDCELIAMDRFPKPSIYHCSPGHSRERYLKAAFHSDLEEEGIPNESADLPTFIRRLSEGLRRVI